MLTREAYASLNHSLVIVLYSQIPMFMGVVSVSTYRSQDGLETYFRLGLGKPRGGFGLGLVSDRKPNVSVSCHYVSFACRFTLFFTFLHLLQKLIVSNFDWSDPELLSLCCTGLLIYWEVLAVLPICRPYNKLPKTSCNKSIAEYYKSSSGDEIPERDVTYLLSVYLFTTELRHTCTYGIFSE